MFKLSLKSFPERKREREREREREINVYFAIYGPYLAVVCGSAVQVIKIINIYMRV